MESGALRGMTQAEVEELLGPPQPGYGYFLCASPVLPIDRCWFRLELDEGGRVVGEEIWTD